MIYSEGLLATELTIHFLMRYERLMKLISYQAYKNKSKNVINYAIVYFTLLFSLVLHTKVFHFFSYLFLSSVI